MKFNMDERMKKYQDDLESIINQLQNAKAELDNPFRQEEELTNKLARLNELNSLLNLDGSKPSTNVINKVTALSEKLSGETQSIKDIRNLFKEGAKDTDNDIDELIKTIMKGFASTK
ncbi:hypothetical protein [Anaerocolumna chitinilytica]|uniref:Uncharacterized protein n=1 Tax=Anaerocolumna chitinilytica TaxID=1727145 RepID=A0A7I8DMS6_9FIRM|nr:hypothetical protein [Anaerocolumna chitinilytica]BCJ99718.1 hypothetical protein bsdcttw_27590 [Anaerocolumna chitinilytica]